jgi:ribokinase
MPKRALAEVREGPAIDVLVFGSINLDYVTVTSHELPRPGETVVGRSFSTFNGGKGANEAVAAARLGVHVALVGAVGADDVGTRLVQDLNAERLITTSHVRRVSQAQSGVACVTVAGATGENSVVVVPGANALVSSAMALAARPLLLRGVRAVILQNEVPFAATAAMAQLASELAVRWIVWNPSPLPSEIPADFFPAGVNLLVANEAETLKLCRSQRDSADVGACARSLSRKHRCHVLVTLGQRGALAFELQAAGAIPIPAWPVDRVVDTTGAGDCFLGSLCAFLSLGATLLRAAEFANQVAALSCTRLGAQPSFPPLGQCPGALVEFVNSLAGRGMPAAARDGAA